MTDGVYTFGDKIPAGPDTDLFVSYKVEGIDGGILAGPYRDYITAEEQLLDIKTYEGVTGANIVPRTALKRTVFFPYAVKP